MRPVGCLDDGHRRWAFRPGVEVTGERKKDKIAKVDAAGTYWVPAVSNLGEFGRWAFTEITDPWEAADLIAQNIHDIARDATMPA